MQTTAARETRDNRPQTTTLVAAWAVTLALSMLPDVICGWLGSAVPPWLYPAKVCLAVGSVASGMAFKALRPITRYAAMLLALLLLEWVHGRLAAGWHEYAPNSFAGRMLVEQSMRVAVAVAVVIVLAALRFRPATAYLTRGNLDAPAAPVRWLGIDDRVRWKRLGLISGPCISLGTLAFLALAGRFSLSAMAGALALAPVVLLLAALNSFAEEVTYRSALLAPAVPVLGQRQSVLLTAAFFGFGHYYGVPYGVIGVLMAGLLGWFLGKAMVETKGLFWPWFIHFLQDVMIFGFMAAGAVTAGGQ